MERAEVIALGAQKGFSAEQIEFLLDVFAEQDHGHEAEDIVVDSDDGETLDSFIDDLVATNVFGDQD